jgi:uncharacterized protein YigA (DUF484 family)
VADVLDELRMTGSLGVRDPEKYAVTLTAATVQRAREEIERLTRAIESALRCLGDGNRVLATDVLARALVKEEPGNG